MHCDDNACNNSTGVSTECDILLAFYVFVSTTIAPEITEIGI